MSTAILEAPTRKPHSADTALSYTDIEIFRYPDEVRDAFLTQGTGQSFLDGSHVTAQEIWHWVSEEGPRRYPNQFARGRVFGPSEDVWLLAGIKLLYLTTTLALRLSKATERGVPVVFVQGGQGHEPYYAAGGIPSRPAHVGNWSVNIEENLSKNEADTLRAEQRALCHNHLTVDACQTAGFGVIQAGRVPIPIVAPYLANRCSDIAYGTEAHRHGPVKVALNLVDLPVADQQDKSWAADYTAANLRTLVETIAGLSGKTVTDEDLWEEYRFHNEKRRLAREFAKLWWEAPQPPTNSQDRQSIQGLGNESHGDPVAAKQILEEALEEVRGRVARGERGFGVSKDPIRLFILGSCVGPNIKNTEANGAVVAGKDDGWSEIVHDVPESGTDPYLALATTILNYPYELPTEKRARWTSEQVKAARADAVLFMHQWGCNYQSSISRLVTDIVTEETGLPGTVLERSFNENPTGQEQFNTRMETFIEIVRNTKA